MTFTEILKNIGFAQVGGVNILRTLFAPKSGETNPDGTPTTAHPLMKKVIIIAIILALLFVGYHFVKRKFFK